MRRNPKISGTTHNVFGIQTGVAIAFLVRDKAKLDGCSIHYARREDAELAREKLAYLREARLSEVAFENITPDKRGNWLKQSNSDFEHLMPLTDRRTKLNTVQDEERAVFRLFSNGVKTNRDAWVYDFDARNLQDKTLFFAGTYNELLDKNDHSYPPVIKWSSTLSDRFNRRERLAVDHSRPIRSLYRPFTVKHHFADMSMNDRLTKNHYEMFGAHLQEPNSVICFRGLGSHKPFDVFSTDKVMEHQLLMNMQCLPLYRYTDDGERVSNITGWGIRRINDHYKKEWGEDFKNIYPGGITAEHIFAYTYAVLHDPVYRHDYAVDLTREFPRLPLYHDFQAWERMGQELLDLHIGFESAEPHPLERIDQSGGPKRVIASF